METNEFSFSVMCDSQRTSVQVAKEQQVSIETFPSVRALIKTSPCLQFFRGTHLQALNAPVFLLKYLHGLLLHPVFVKVLGI